MREDDSKIYQETGFRQTRPHEFVYAHAARAADPRHRVVAVRWRNDRRRTLTLEQRWRPVPTFELVWGYKVESHEFLLNQTAGPDAASGLLAGPIFSVILDQRDSPFDATRGMSHSSSFQFGIDPFGSDLNFVISPSGVRLLFVVIEARSRRGS